MRMSFEVHGQRLRQLRVENGKRPARLVTIRKLADALGVEPKELMKREE
jgi:transcriptional regulator with XRE-family HTH domain